MRHPNKHSRIRLFLATGLIAFIFSWVSLGTYSTPAYAQATPSAPGATDTEEQPASEGDGTTCAIERMGWILCPAIETFGKIGDSAFQYLSDAFLETEPELVSNDKQGTKYAWEFARNIANILFIITFLVIIYSQITSAGLSNYGIKRMLPRLIIAAILVNISYYICQAMVDVTNILGYELQNFLVDAAAEISDVSAMPPQTGYIDASTSNGFLGTVALAALGAVGAVWFILPILMLGIGTVVITVLVVIVILLMRKALIILLVVVSPIAFVCYLLPNTEKYFSKWLNMFWQLLLVFPVISMLFGGGQIASAIILAAGSNDSGKYTSSDTASSSITDSEKCIKLANMKPGNAEEAKAQEAECGGPGSTSLTLGLVAAGVAVAPLLAVWAVLKGAISAAGAIGGKISGAVDKGINSGSAWASKNTAIGRGMAARQAIKQNFKDQRFASKMSRTGRSGLATRIAARGISGNAGIAAGKLAANINGEGKISSAARNVVNATTGSMQAQNTKLSSNFAGVAAKIDDQEVKDRQALLTRMLQNTVGQTDADNNVISTETKLADALERAIVNGDKAGAKAATDLLLSQGGPGREMLRTRMSSSSSAINTASDDMRAAFDTHIAQNYSSLKGTDADMYAYVGSRGTDRSKSLADFSDDESVYRSLTNDQMATQSGNSLAGGGASRALGIDQVVFNQNGERVVVKRGGAILASKAGETIKDKDRHHFEGTPPPPGP